MKGNLTGSAAVRTSAMLSVAVLLWGCGNPVPLKPLPLDSQSMTEAQLLAHQRASIMEELRRKAVKEAEDRKAELKAASEKSQEAVQLNISDEFIVDVWLKDGITQLVGFPFRGVIQPDGTEFVPAVGDVTCAGKRPDEIREDVRRRLAVTLHEPIVNFRVVKHVGATVTIVGEVLMHPNRDTGPGVYPIRGATALTDFIMAAGGYTAKADTRRVRVVYHDGSVEFVDIDKILAGDMRKNVVLRGGETVYIPEMKRTGSVLVMGQVRMPGLYGLEADTRLSRVLAQAGGVNPNGSRKRIVLVRGDLYKPQAIYVNLDRILRYGFQEEDVSLQHGDTLYVPLSRIGVFQEFLSVVALPISAARQYVFLEDELFNKNRNQ